MRFYTNVHVNAKSAFVRGYDNGVRFEYEQPFSPHLFLPSPTPSEFRTLDGKYVKPVHFLDSREAREFIKRYDDVGNFPVYGTTSFTYQCIYENFKGDVEYDVDAINVVSIDIETSTQNGFPNIAMADKEIITLSMRKRGKCIVLGTRPYIPKSTDVKYHQCKNEVDLLTTFLMVWNSNQWKPDVVTGWNIESFDIPYLYTRISNILGVKEAKKLSPWGIVNSRSITGEDDGPFVYDIIGIATLDYLALYKKFSYTPQESYKLDHIAEYELGEKKLDYSEYDSMHEFYVRNFEKFVDYNIHDVVLVDKLEEKLKFIEQVFAIAYDAKVNYVDTFTTVRIWDVIIANYLMDKNIVVPHFKTESIEERIAVDKRMGPIIGAYVKDPQVGLHKWVCSFDLNSLYPHLIMQYNISPETFRGMESDVTIEGLIDDQMDPDLLEKLESQNMTMGSNGALFDKDFKGFLPTLMETMYNDRSAWKKRMIEAKKKLELIDAEIARRKS